ncbi:MAG: CocE/NonD family hydrolase [Rhodopirellula sp.]|nr:CocE/NonD family hydrolase [Rhodopirellula sp.]
MHHITSSLGHFGRSCLFAAMLGFAMALLFAERATAAELPSEVVFPQEDWIRITPKQAGLNAEEFGELLRRSDVHGGGWGGNQPAEGQWGAVLTRGGYLVHTWGNSKARFQSASLGKCVTRVLFGMTVEAGLIDPDEPIWKTWTGRGELSHPHKYLDTGLHRRLTWRHLLEHQGGFVLESGYHWRRKSVFHATIPVGVTWTGDPGFDNFCHSEPGIGTRYSSGGYWRLGQALTALWNCDLKDVVDDRLFRKLGIPADRWDWLPGKEVHDNRNFYPEFPGYGEYVDPPYEIKGHVVRGAPGWIVMAPEDLARFGLLIATGGTWKGERLVGAEWLRGHAGLDIHVVAGDPQTLVSIAKINTKGFPFGQEVGSQGRFSFPQQLIAGPIQLAQEASPPRYQVEVEKNVRIPMRDGVTLAADLYRPNGPGKFPALMTLVYYPTGGAEAERFARHGYVGVVVNSRGRNGSEGDWEPYVNEPRDAYDAQQWIGQQLWCDGKIGMFGQSYNAFTQTMSAPLASPHLRCILPVEGQQTNFGHLYNDGVPQLNVIFTFGLYATGPTRTGPHIPLGSHYFHLPLASAADKADHPQAQRIKTWLEHSHYDDYWKSYGVKEKYGQIRAPAWFVSGWYDNLVHENWRNFRGFREGGGSKACRDGTRIQVGGMVHGGNTPPFDRRLRWYDHWLKGLQTGIDKLPPIEIFVMGADCWRYEYEWPPARARLTRYYLHSGGRANSACGDGQLRIEPSPADVPPDRFVYDPADPVPTLGGQMSTHADLWGPVGRHTVQQRRDVLVYTTSPLERDVEVTGPVELQLHAASDAVDTDFTATLTDVHPDGTAIHVCEGIRRASFRDSLENPTPIEPGKVYVYTVSLWETSMVFKAGHRIRLEISSSNFPRYARNLNTGLPIGTSAEMKRAHQTVHHDAACPSHLILPVIP